MARADHRGRHTELDRFEAAFPRVTRCPGGRPRPAVRRCRVRPRLLERRDRARRGRPRGAAPVRRGALPRGRARLRHDAEPLVPARPAHAAAVRALAARGRARERLLRARGFDDVLDPLGPKELAALFPYPVRVVNTGLTLIAVGAAMSTRPSGCCTSSSSGSRSTTSSMAELWAAGVRGDALRLSRRGRRRCSRSRSCSCCARGGWLPFDRRLADWLALAFGAFVIVYALIPQHWLGGGATHKGVLFALAKRPRPGRRVLPRARARAPTGEICARSARRSSRRRPAWRRSGWWTSTRSRSRGGVTRARPAGSRTSSDSTTQGLSKLPENFIYNIGNDHALRRLVSTFLSPLASSYLLVVALLLWRPGGLGPGRGARGGVVVFCAAPALRRPALDTLALVVPRARARPARIRAVRGDAGRVVLVAAAVLVGSARCS